MISKISIYRKSKGMTQEELAKKADVSVRALTSAENDINKTNMSTLKKIAKALDKSVSDLYEE